jgi:Arc/MetJ-type ribon-helix-helix transcriptional regulator
MPEKEMIGVRVTEETKGRIEEQLEYGDSMSEWVREAILLRLESKTDGMEGNCQSRSEMTVAD